MMWLMDSNKRWKLFSTQLGIRRKVGLLQSELVKVPVAIGWLKPVILLPMGVILQLSTEQLESILWHELAHISRRDYLVNILQELVETVFFFNPGLLWLSSLIRAEREACCDDMVLSRMSRKANYLEALLAFGHADGSRTTLAMSIGSGNQLRNRLKRMVSRENRRLGVAEKVVLVAGLIALSAFTGLPKTTSIAMKHLMHAITKKNASKEIQKPAAPKQLVKIQPVIRSVQRGTDTLVKSADTSIHFISVLFNKSDADIANSEISAKDDKGNIYHLVVADNKLTVLDINKVKVDESKLPQYQYIVNEIDRQIDEKRTVMMMDGAGFKAMSPKVKFGDKIWTDTANRKLRLGWKKSDSLWLKQSWKKPMPGMMKSNLMWQRMKLDSSSYAADQARAHGVIADLVAEKVVANASAVKWFGLSDTEFIVNGQKQPDALQQKLKTKYGVHENYGLYYGPAEMTGTGVFINDDARVNFQKRSLGQLKLKQQQFMKQDAQFKSLSKKSWSPDKGLLLQQQNLLKLDLQEKSFFRPNFSLNDIIASVTDDLVDENIIKDKSGLSSFKLTNTFLVVNGKKQSDDIHEKLKTKYLIKPHYSIDQQISNDPKFGIHYAKSGSMGIGIDVDRDDP